MNGPGHEHISLCNNNKMSRRNYYLSRPIKELLAEFRSNFNSNDNGWIAVSNLFRVKPYLYVIPTTEPNIYIIAQTVLI